MFEMSVPSSPTLRHSALYLVALGPPFTRLLFARIKRGEWLAILVHLVEPDDLDARHI